MDKEIIFEAETINDFINEYTAKETIRLYKIQLKKYFQYLNADPDNYVKDIRNMDNGNKLKIIDGYEKDITNYRNDLITKDYSPKAIHNYVSCVKMFLEHHHIDLDITFWKKLKKRGIEKVVESICDFKIPTPDELKSILTHASTKARAVFLLQSSSGMRIGEVCSLRLSDIDLSYEYPHITIRGVNTKTRAKGRTRCSPEAKDSILEWLKIRDSEIKLRLDKEPEEYQELFTCSPKSARHMWNNLLDKSQHTEKDSSGKYERHKMSTHCLRRYFRNEFSKYNNDLATYLMNQRTSLDKKYRDWTDEYLDEQYALGVKHLLVSEREVSDERINDLDSKLKEVTQEKDGQIFDLREEMKERKMEILELRLTLQELKNKKN